MAASGAAANGRAASVRRKARRITVALDDERRRKFKEM
jgi:hypothetical protein